MIDRSNSALSAGSLRLELGRRVVRSRNGRTNCMIHPDDSRIRPTNPTRPILPNQPMQEIFTHSNRKNNSQDPSTTKLGPSQAPQLASSFPPRPQLDVHDARVERHRQKRLRRPLTLIIHQIPLSHNLRKYAPQLQLCELHPFRINHPSVSPIQTETREEGGKTNQCNSSVPTKTENTPSHPSSIPTPPPTAPG